jgi:starch synthase
VPIVRNTGGLRDTVIDISAPDNAGYGLLFENPSAFDLIQSISRAVGWYFNEPAILHAARERMMQIDNSWEKSAERYIEIYKN